MRQNLNQRSFGVLSIGVALVLNLTTANLCSSQGTKDPWKNPPGHPLQQSQTPPRPDTTNHPLLAGRATEYGTMQKRCEMAEGGELSMAIRTRIGDYAMCCVLQSVPFSVRAGDKVLVDGVLEKSETEFHVKLETTDNFQIFLNQHDRNAGEFHFNVPLDGSEDLKGQESVLIRKFCIAAVGPGGLQTIKVKKAVVSPASVSTRE